MRRDKVRIAASSIAAAWMLLLLCVLVPCEAAAQPVVCKPTGDVALRDEFWRRTQPEHRLMGQVLKGMQPIAVDTALCARSPLQQLIAELGEAIRQRGIVLLGEVHDNPEHHKVRGDILRVAARGLRPAVVFEHIRVDQQAALDGFYAKAARSRRLWRADDLLRELTWENSGWPAGRIFEPLFDAALRAKLPIHAGNAPKGRIRELARGGPDDITPPETARLALARSLPGPLAEALAGELEASHCGMVPASAFGAMSLAQRYTDAHLAGRLVEAADTHGAAVLLAGNGHVRSDRGVPWYARQLAPGRRILVVVLAEVEEGKIDGSLYIPRGPEGASAADYILLTPRHVRPDPCAKMRQGRP